MPRPILKSRRTGEEGQTLVLVAMCLFVLIAMAALAIDVTTLYAARGEMQRAADAAALAGAKAFVDSGVTTAPSAPNPDGSNLQPLARTIATAYITAELAQNTVGGVTPSIPPGTVTFDFTSHPGNPQVTVTLERADVPTFFARIFGQKLVTVRATAVAEAYNSSLPPGGAVNMPPVGPQGVKPWLVVNIDPLHGGGPFIRPDGSIANPGAWVPTGPPPNSWTCPPQQARPAASSESASKHCRIFSAAPAHLQIPATCRRRCRIIRPGKPVLPARAAVITLCKASLVSTQPTRTNTPP